jgi:hypothetical protein
MMSSHPHLVRHTCTPWRPQGSGGHEELPHQHWASPPHIECLVVCFIVCCMVWEKELRNNLEMMSLHPYLVRHTCTPWRLQGRGVHEGLPHPHCTSPSHIECWLVCCIVCCMVWEKEVRIHLEMIIVHPHLVRQRHTPWKPQGSDGHEGLPHPHWISPPHIECLVVCCIVGCMVWEKELTIHLEMMCLHPHLVRHTCTPWKPQGSDGHRGLPHPHWTSPPHTD